MLQSIYIDVMNQIKQVLDAANATANMHLSIMESIIRACELHDATFILGNGFGRGIIALSNGKHCNVQCDALRWTLQAVKDCFCVFAKT